MHCTVPGSVVGVVGGPVHVCLRERVPEAVVVGERVTVSSRAIELLLRLLRLIVRSHTLPLYLLLLLLINALAPHVQQDSKGMR